jgi:hypothetical protein
VRAGQENPQRGSRAPGVSAKSPCRMGLRQAQNLGGQSRSAVGIGLTLIEAEHKKPDGRGQVCALTIFVDAGDQLR